MLATLQFPGCSDLKIGVILALLLSSDTPPSSPSDVWKIIGDGVAGTSGHSLSTHGCLRAPGLLTRSSALKDPDQVLFHQGYIVHVPVFPPDPWSLGFLEAGLASRGWAEESVQYLSLVPVLCCSVPRSTEGTHFFKPSFCPLLVVFDILARFNPFWVLSFVTSSLGAQTVFWYSSHSWFLFDFVQELLVLTYNPPGIFPNFLLTGKLSSLLWVHFCGPGYWWYAWIATYLWLLND